MAKADPPMTAPIRMPIPNATELIGTVRTLQDAVEVFRTMKERLGLTYKFIDEVSGLAKGHADKVLSRTPQKRLGYDTFAVFCELFGVMLEVKIDIEAVKRMEKVWETRQRPPYPPDCKPGRVSKKLIEMAKPHVLRDFAALGGAKRAASLPARLRSKMSRKGGKSRMRKVTKAERTVMCKKGWETRRKNKAAQLLIAPEIGAAGAAPDVGSLELLQGGVDETIVLA